MIRKTTLDQWRILQAVVDNGGYAQAAKVLHRSHSSLNHAVIKLQKLLDVQLLEVKGRKAVLTDAGRVLLRRSRILSQHHNELEYIATNLSIGWESEITISLEHDWPRDKFLTAFEEFLPLSRGSRVHFEENVLAGSEEVIRKQKVDIAVTAFTPVGFVGEYLCSVKFLPVAHPNHPIFFRQQPITQQDLIDELQVVIADTSSSVEVEYDIGWLKSEARWTVANFAMAIKILKNGLGFSWLPEHLIRDDLKHDRLKHIPLKQSSFLTNDLSLVLPKAELTGPCALALADQILKHVRSDFDPPADQ